jgi:hypothetical protein
MSKKQKFGFERINVVTKLCACHKSLDKGVCKQLITACVVTQSCLPGLAQMPKKFRIVRRKKIETIVATKNKWWLREMNQLQRLLLLINPM